MYSMLDARVPKETVFLSRKTIWHSFFLFRFWHSDSVLLLYHRFDRDVDPHDSIKHADFLVRSCAGPATCHKCSIAVEMQYSTQFCQSGFFTSMQVFFCVWSCVGLCPGASVR